jgi:hypothetical protein
MSGWVTYAYRKEANVSQRNDDKEYSSSLLSDNLSLKKAIEKFISVLLKTEYDWDIVVSPEYYVILTNCKITIEQHDELLAAGATSITVGVDTFFNKGD